MPKSGNGLLKCPNKATYWKGKYPQPLLFYPRRILPNYLVHVEWLNICNTLYNSLITDSKWLQIWMLYSHYIIAVSWKPVSDATQLVLDSSWPQYCWLHRTILGMTPCTKLDKKHTMETCFKCDYMVGG